jgi:hypothetical protein
MTVILLLEFQTPGPIGKEVRVYFKANIFMPFTFMLRCIVTNLFLITNQTHQLSKFILL